MKRCICCNNRIFFWNKWRKRDAAIYDFLKSQRRVINFCSQECFDRYVKLNKIIQIW